MKKIIVSVMLCGALQFAFAQNNPTGTEKDKAAPINPVTDQFQNGNQMGWENQNITKADMAIIPAPASRDFKTRYPNQANVTWYSYENGYTAVYMTPAGMEERVMYDRDGKPMGTGMQVKREILPTTSNVYLKEHYAGKTYDRIYEVSSPTGEKYYMVYVDSKWVRFDPKGNYVGDK